VAIRKSCHTAFRSFRMKSRSTRRPRISHWAVARRKFSVLKRTSRGAPPEARGASGGGLDAGRVTYSIPASLRVVPLG
jgi:hypothetical protein